MRTTRLPRPRAARAFAPHAPRAFARGALAVLAFAAILASPRRAPADPTPTSRVVVNVGTFRNHDGALGCRLFSRADGFPERSAGTVEKRVKITGATALCTFDGLRPGTYAIAVIHDENGNGKLDKSFFGVPTEGYGVSNNHTHAMSSPTWEESRFVVEPGKNLGLAIGLRY